MRPGHALLPLFLLAGCGGGGSSHTDAGLSKITIDWPATTRSFTGSPIAGSARVIFTTTATTPAEVATFVVVRPSGSGEVKKTYTLSPTKIPMSSYFLTVRFCAGADANLANEVGVGATAVTVTSSGRLQGSDGKELGDVAFIRTLTDLSLVAGRTVSVGQKTSLVVQATSPGGNLVVIPFTQLTLTSSDSGVLTANDDGTVTGVKAGTAEVTVSAFGLTSAPTAVTVQ